ncbi:hypothetical protein L249_6229 [Ophiocordyceps polyrhachis-furcata BCC 54312]|uniref:Uncharacterized protein n=1 Tax=Ophiocordyceps polyrhachis-furcata BCC 54312 TaxID=1330021 RepID=A0A367L149_9HYPO|nr:hypothetical protein L249_6229 [Ophiocordyceps polyrhachis-furcata BCC 54312]
MRTKKDYIHCYTAYSGVGSIGLTRTSLPPNHQSSKYVRVLQVGTLKYLEKIISISFSHLLNTNTSPASNSSSIASFRLSPRVQLSDSGYLYTFNLFFTAFLFTFRPTNYLIRTLFSDAF